MRYGAFAARPPPVRTVKPSARREPRPWSKRSMDGQRVPWSREVPPQRTQRTQRTQRKTKTKPRKCTKGTEKNKETECVGNFPFVLLVPFCGLIVFLCVLC